MTRKFQGKEGVVDFDEKLNSGLFLQILIATFILLSIFFAYVVFVRPSQGAIPSKMSSELPLDILPFDKGTYRLSLKDFSNEPLFLTFTSTGEANFLMLRKGSISDLRISIQNGESLDVHGDASTYTPRYFLPLPKNQQKIVVKIENLDPSRAELIIDEIALCQKNASSWKVQKLHVKLLILALAAIACLGSLSYMAVTREQALRYGAIYFFIWPIAFHFSRFILGFYPDWARDLRIDFASGPLQESAGSNLNYGLHMASSILQGLGPVIDGMPNWARMPGYGFFLALSGNGSDMLQMAMNSVVLQVFAFALALSIFFRSALRIMPPFTAALISTLIVFLPFRFYYLQIESLMPAIVLLLSAAICLFIEKHYENVVIPLKNHILLHFSLALWFVVRTDILPAWALLSLFLYGRTRKTWKLFLIPVGLVLSIGLSWAIFKFPYTGEFSMTTHSIGASFMGGLWEVPNHFIWLPADESYYSWIESLGMNPKTKETSSLAAKEAFRFCLTYPIYIFSLIWHKFLLFAKLFSQFCDFRIFNWVRLWLLLVIASAFIFRHKRFQTLLLSWILLFNVPTFFIFYSSGGRFYEAPNICLLAAALPLLLDREFYRKISAHKFKFAGVILTFVFITQFGFSIDNALIASPKLRYWSPFLDPNKSTLNVVRKMDD